MSLPASGSCLETREAPGGTVSLSIRCPALRYPEVETMSAELNDLVEELRPRTLLLNFAGVEYLAAGALGQLVRLHRKLRARGGQLVLSNLSPRLWELFQITRLHTLFEIGEAV